MLRIARSGVSLIARGSRKMSNKKFPTLKMYNLTERATTGWYLYNNKGEYSPEFYDTMKELIVKTNNHMLKFHIKNIIGIPVACSLGITFLFEVFINIIEFTTITKLHLISLPTRFLFAPVFSILNLISYMTHNQKIAYHNMTGFIMRDLNKVKDTFKKPKEIEFIKNIEENLYEQIKD